LVFPASRPMSAAGCLVHHQRWDRTEVEYCS
jgi:hypothetical protein